MCPFKEIFTVHLRSSFISRICYSFFLFHKTVIITCLSNICIFLWIVLTWSLFWAPLAYWYHFSALLGRSQVHAESTIWFSCCHTRMIDLFRKLEKSWKYGKLNILIEWIFTSSFKFLSSRSRRFTWELLILRPSTRE